MARRDGKGWHPRHGALEEVHLFRVERRPGMKASDKAGRGPASSAPRILERGGKKKSAGWSSVREQLKAWRQPALMSLIKDLYDSSPANRDFLRARVQAEETGGAALEAYRRKIIEQFFPSRGFGKLKLAEARKAIRDYRKAAGNAAGTVQLMLTFVENGTEFTLDVGDIDGPFTITSRLS
jgi:hypothetical protein